MRATLIFYPFSGLVGETVSRIKIFVEWGIYSPNSGVGNLRLAGRMRLFCCHDAALQFHAQMLIIILFYFLKLIKKYTAKKYFKLDKNTQQRTVRIGGVESS